MHPMEWEYVRENTKIVQPVPLATPLAQDCTKTFIAITQDMDNPDLVVVFKGELFFHKVVQVNDDERSKLAELPDNLPTDNIVYKGGITLKPTTVDIKEYKNQTVEQVKKTLFKRRGIGECIVFTTVSDRWQEGALIAASDNMVLAMSEGGDDLDGSLQ
jgi:hypothetical protein